MGQNSKIEWTNHTANLWHGCTKVHAGCDNCYAEALSHRFGDDIWGNNKPRKEIRSVWHGLWKMQQVARARGEIHRVFVGSMMDIFEKPMPLTGASQPECNTGVLRDRLFDEITQGYYPNLLFLLLTKRPGNINKYIPDSWKENPPPSVMFGCSPVNQETFDTLVPQQLAVKGKRFLSIEPQLGPIELSLEHRFGIDWIIQGGESGPNRRPFDLDWALSMRQQCHTLGIPYFFKQIDKVTPIPDYLQIRQFPLY